MSAPSSIFQAAQRTIRLPEPATRADTEHYWESLALECESIAADPLRRAQAEADFPQGGSRRYKTMHGSGAAR